MRLFTRRPVAKIYGGLMVILQEARGNNSFFPAAGACFVFVAFVSCLLLGGRDFFCIVGSFLGRY